MAKIYIGFLKDQDKNACYAQTRITKSEADIVSLLDKYDFYEVEASPVVSVDMKVIVDEIG